MPKVTHTRTVRSEQLLERLKRGPALNHIMTSDAFTPEQARQSVMLWLNTWVIPEVEDLIPELRKRQTKGARDE